MCRSLSQFLDKEILKENEPMSRHTTFGIGGEVLAFVEPRNKKELVKSVCVLEQLGLPFKVIGAGSNLLFASGKLNEVIVSTTKMENSISLHQTSVKVSSGAMFAEVCIWCAKHGLSGLENMFGIPATIGGMVVMNAGAFGSSMSDVVESVEVYENGKIEVLSKNELQFGHHYSNLIGSKKVVLSVELNLKRLAPSVIYSKLREKAKLRQLKHPVGKSAGCVFRPAEGDLPAGKLIELAGLKGQRVGGARISEKHANFILNDGGATDGDVIELMERAKKIVKDKFDIDLQTEIEYIGDRDAFNR